MYLSKSKYCNLWQCPKLLWLATNQPEPMDAARLDRMNTGNQVGDLAMELFGAFTETTVLHPDGRPNIPAMLEKTRQCLDQGVQNICEAAFSYEGLYCAVDILRKEPGGYSIYEVKSASHICRVYAADIAYQKYVLEHCGITVTGTYLVCINSDYVREQTLDIQQLFQVVDLSSEVAEEYESVELRLAQARQILAQKQEPATCIGTHCRQPYPCIYWDHCTRHLPSPSVFDLYRMRFDKALEYCQKGQSDLASLSAEAKLSPKQQRQIRHHLNDEPDEVDISGIRGFLNTLFYPMCFFDFESTQYAIPPYPNCKPYVHIPFQYSLHYRESAQAPLEHREFLAQPGEDPRRAIAESICRDIPANACVLVYNRDFELGRLQELAQLFPDLAPRLLQICDNIRDLLIPFQSGFYYNRAMGGSFSIKSVLPALFPEDPELDYHNLEGVHNGSEAMSLFPRLGELSAQEAAAARAQLLAYCKLDTYALVKILQKLQQVCDLTEGE